MCYVDTFYVTVEYIAGRIAEALLLAVGGGTSVSQVIVAGLPHRVCRWSLRHDPIHFYQRGSCYWGTVRIAKREMRMTNELLVSPMTYYIYALTASP